MEFTIDNVKNNVCIYLEGGRSSYIESSLEIEDDYEWDDCHWGYIDHFSVHVNEKDNLYRVVNWEGDSGHNAGNWSMTAEEVVTLINELCNGVPIERIN
jgi:hypothetical protein